MAAGGSELRGLAMAVDCVSGAAMVRVSTTIDVLDVAEVALSKPGPGSGNSVTNQITTRGLSGYFPKQRFRFIELEDFGSLSCGCWTQVQWYKCWCFDLSTST